METVRERRNDPEQVWHEGNRIRRGDSTGYADTVPDETIWQHLADDAEKRDVDAVIFCASVLRLRTEMRALAERYRDSIVIDAAEAGR